MHILVRNQDCWRSINFTVVDEVLLDKEMNRLIWCSRNRIVGYEIHCIDDTINTVISLSAQE